MKDKIKVNPSFNSSPDILASFSFNNLLSLAYSLIVCVKAVLNPVKCVPPVLGIELVNNL